MPWGKGGKTRKPFIADSTMMHYVCARAGVPCQGWVSVGVMIDGYPIARIIGGNGVYLHGHGDDICCQALRGQQFSTVAVMPMFKALPAAYQQHFEQHERASDMCVSLATDLQVCVDCRWSVWLESPFARERDR